MRGIGLGAALSVIMAAVLGAAGAFAITSCTSAVAAFKPLPEQLMLAIMEELLFRAVLLFALAHLPNEHVTALAVLNTGIAGLGFCAAWMLTRSLWLPAGMHFA